MVRVLAYNLETRGIADLRKDFWMYRKDEWEQAIIDETGWTEPAKLHLYYKSETGKGPFRMVIRPGNKCTFPPYDSEFPSLHGCDMSRIQTATLTFRDGGTMDLTRKVRKYEGIHGNFHADLGLHVKVRDIFEWWNDEDLHGARMTVEHMDGTVREYSFDSNDIIRPKEKKRHASWLSFFTDSNLLTLLSSTTKARAIIPNKDDEPYSQGTDTSLPGDHGDGGGDHDLGNQATGITETVESPRTCDSRATDDEAHKPGGGGAAIP